jgi:hypothetical protein
MRTRTSYQAAWPVMGSELESARRRQTRQFLGDQVVEQEARCDSLASGVRFQAPAALPIAFQVQTVPGSTASE